MESSFARSVAARLAPRSLRRIRSAVETLESRCLLSAASSFVPGELIVGFRPGVAASDIEHFYQLHGLSEREALDGQVRGNASRLKLVNVPAARTMKLASSLARDPRVAYAEPNYILEDAFAAATPTDTFFPIQWALNNVGQFSTTPDADIDALEAWNVTTGSPDVLVAVIDSGVMFDHPDLATNIWTNPFETAGDGIDNDGNGYVDDVHGIDAEGRTGDPTDFDIHGTAVAGIIGATAYDQGVVGVAPGVRMIPIKLSHTDNIKTSAVVRSFLYINYLKNVQGQNIVVSNNSWVSNALVNSQAAKDAIAGLDQPGMSPILHVFSAGNLNSDNDNPATPIYPANFGLDNIITVAATDWNDHMAGFSNYGATSVDLAAPGFEIFTTTPGGRYHPHFGGTSGAAPHVAGAAALVWSAFPNLTAAQVKQRLLDGVDPLGHIGDNAAKPTVTNGRLNVANALVGAPAAGDNRAPAAVATLSAAPAGFGSATLAWTATGDDGAAGRAATYDVRYSTTPITKSNWDTAARATGEPRAGAAGAAETFVLSGLDPAATYYFAMTVRDDMGNESAISNVAQDSTTAATVIFADDVEQGSNGWTASGLWHPSTSRAYSGTTAWYYGIDATRNYDTGTPNSGALTSPVISLKGATAPVLIYKEWRELEDLAFGEFARVQISTGANKWVTLSESEYSTSVDPLNWQERVAGFGWNLSLESRLSTPQWVGRSLDLSAFAGKSIQVRFAFDSADALFNQYEGWYVDDVNVFSTSAPATQAVAPQTASRAPDRFASAPVIAAWSLVDPDADDEDTLLAAS